MEVFFDTSVLVAAMVLSHSHHAPAAAALERVVRGEDDGSVCCHSLAELYAVLTRLPVSPAIHPSEAHRLIKENVLARLRLVPLTAEDYRRCLQALASGGWPGGMIYDALLLRASEKSRAEAVLTFNIVHFRRLARTPEVRGRIRTP